MMSYSRLDSLQRSTDLAILILYCVLISWMFSIEVPFVYSSKYFSIAVIIDSLLGMIDFDILGFKGIK